MGVLTKYFSFLKAGWKEYVDVEKHINNNFDLADNLFHAQSEEIKKKEPIITKKSGFNLEKSDSINLKDTNKLATALALASLNDEVIKKATATVLGRVKIGKNLTIKSDGTLEGKDPYSLPKATTSIIGGVKVGRNLTIKTDGTLEAKDQEVDLGTTSGTALEGSKLAETLGIPYGGILNNSTSKVAGTAYYDNTTKKTYKCTSTTSLNYAESTKFEPISNNDLLLKFQNLSKPTIEYKTSEKYSNYSSTSKLLKIKKVYSLTIIATQDVTSAPLKTGIIIPKKDLYVHEGTLKYHHEDSDYYYYYFTNLGSYWGDNNFTLIHL